MGRIQTTGSDLATDSIFQLTQLISAIEECIFAERDIVKELDTVKRQFGFEADADGGGFYHDCMLESRHRQRRLCLYNARAQYLRDRLIIFVKAEHMKEKNV